MARRAAIVHLVGVVVAALAAVVLLFTLIPYLAALVFPVQVRARGLRGVSLYYITVALIPVVLWLIPPFVRTLARGTYKAHRLVMGEGGFYLRFPTKPLLRFRDTLLMSIGPFALDLLVITEVTYFVSTPDARLLGQGLVAIPLLLVLAGLITALVPGPWLLDALGLRLVTPERGEIVRAAELFERVLGPVGALALLVSFVTALHSVNYSYEQAAVSLVEWAVRLFPPVLAVVSVYRLIIEPDVVPRLEAWCEAEGIRVRGSLDTDLRELTPGSPGKPPVASDPGGRSHTK